MCEVHESEVPLYTFTYKPSKQDIRRAGCNFLGRRPTRTNIIGYVMLGILGVSKILDIVLAAFFHSLSIWGALYNFLFLFLLAVGFVVFLAADPEQLKTYISDRAAYADRLQAYFFYNDRVEIEGPLGHLTHAYTAYDRLVLTPDLFFLVIFEYRGEHLPWSVVPAEERDGFKAFLLERAAVYNVPVEDREKTARRNSK